MTTDIATRIALVRELSAKATPGPWGFVYDGSSDYSFGPEPDPQGDSIGGAYCQRHVKAQAELEFITESRTLLVQLADDCEALQDEQNRLCLLLGGRDATVAMLQEQLLRITEQLAQVAALPEQWRWMHAASMAYGPIPGDETGHAARWEAVRMCADELDAILKGKP